MSLFIWLFVAFAGTDVDVAQHMAARQAVREAFKAGDHPALLTEARRCHQAFPQNFLGRYYLTVALAMNQKTDEAVEQLAQIAAMGYAMTPAKDPAFKTLLEHPRFAKVAEQFAANAKPVDHSRPAFTIDQPDLFPEGLVYDAKRKRFLISSIHQRKIVSHDHNGKTQDWVAFDPAKPGVAPLSVLGLAITPDGEHLWATTTCLDQTRDGCGELKGRSALAQYRLKDGKPLGIQFFGSADAPSNIGDLVLTAKGDLFLSDSTAGVLYHQKAGTLGGDNPEPWLASPLLRSPQGLALSADESLLYVADYSFGLMLVDLNNKTIAPIQAPEQCLTAGGDGLLRYKNYLIMIQNGIKPHRVVAFALSKDGRSVTGQKVLAANHTAFDEPTLGTLVGDTYTFLANSQWGKYDKTFKPITDQLKPITYLQIDLAKTLK